MGADHKPHPRVNRCAYEFRHRADPRERAIGSLQTAPVANYSDYFNGRAACHSAIRANTTEADRLKFQATLASMAGPDPTQRGTAMPVVTQPYLTSGARASGAISFKSICFHKHRLSLPFGTPTLWMFPSGHASQTNAKARGGRFDKYLIGRLLYGRLDSLSSQALTLRAQTVSTSICKQGQNMHTSHKYGSFNSCDD